MPKLFKVFVFMMSAPLSGSRNRSCPV